MVIGKIDLNFMESAWLKGIKAVKKIQRVFRKKHK